MSRERPGGARSRGQSTLDFALGMSLFLVVLVFAFAFMPSIFTPFESETGGDTAAADRSADRLATYALAERATTPSVLNTTCTTGFLDADGSVPAGCRYDTDGDDLNAALGLQERTRVNVSVRNASGVRTVDGTRLAAGERPPANADPVVTKRVVLLSGEQNRLFVRVW